MEQRTADGPISPTIGTIFTIENAGGGINIFAGSDPRKLPADHPTPASARDSVPISAPAASQRPVPTLPKVAPFLDADRQALEAKKITIDLMMLYTGNAAKHYVRDPDDLLALAVEQTNEILANSGSRQHHAEARAQSTH